MMCLDCVDQIQILLSISIVIIEMEVPKTLSIIPDICVCVCITNFITGTVHHLSIVQVQVFYLSFIVREVCVCVSLIDCKNNRHSNRPSKVKPKPLDRPLVAGCSKGRKSHPLHVRGWDMSQTKKKCISKKKQ